jgi:mono/diheme cytochrome c family protein
LLPSNALTRLSSSFFPARTGINPALGGSLCMHMSTRLKITGIFAALLLSAGAIGGVHTVRRGFSARDEPSAPEIFAARTARSLAVPRRAKALKSPFVITSDGLAEARANWALNCASCHGVNGDGQTEIGRNLYPKPPDLRTAVIQRQTDGELYLTIQNGIRLSAMPAWGEPRDDDRDRWNLVALIRRLNQLTPEEENEIRKYLPRSSDPGPAIASEPVRATRSANDKSARAGNKFASR